MIFYQQKGIRGCRYREMVPGFPEIIEFFAYVMLKILALIVILLMGLHLIRPFGLPGLKRRGDVWKIGLFLVAAMTFTILFRP